MSGKGPTHRLVLASDKDAHGKREYIDLAALWMGGERDSGKLADAYKDRAGIAAIKLTDGRVIDPSKYKLFVNRPSGAVTKTAPAHESWSNDDGTDLPF